MFRKKSLQSVYIVPLLVALCLVSCRKTENAPTLYKEIANQVIGKYILTGINWEGEPVDINGGGMESYDLYSQMMSLPMNEGGRHFLTALDCSADFSFGNVSMHIPMQGYFISLDGKSYNEVNMKGYVQPIFFSYRITSDGTVKADHFDSLGLEDDIYNRNTELKKIHNGETVFDLKGHAFFTAEHTLYNRKEHKLTDGIIQYIFTKIEE